MAKEIDKEKALMVFLRYGLRHQTRKFAEESYELIEALLAPNRANFDNIEHVKEEIADCCVLIEQFKQFYNFSDESIADIANAKIERQLKRIENEKNDNCNCAD